MTDSTPRSQAHAFRLTYALIGKSLLAKLWLNLGAVILELRLHGLAANGRLPGARRRAVQETSTLS